MSKQKHQRISFIDAMAILEKEIKSFKDPMQNSISFVENRYGGNREFINRDVVESLIKKITR